MNSIQSQSKTSYKVQNPHSTRSSLDRVARQLLLLEASSPKHTCPRGHASSKSSSAHPHEAQTNTDPHRTAPHRTSPPLPNQTPDEALAPPLIAAAAAAAGVRSPHDRADPSLVLAFPHARLSGLHRPGSIRAGDGCSVTAVAARCCGGAPRSAAAGFGV